MLADCAGGYDPTSYAIGQLTENWALEPPSPGNAYAQFPTLHYRHSGRIANVSFADGHVEQTRYVLPPTSLWTSYGTTVPNVTVGQYASARTQRWRGPRGSTWRTSVSMGSTIRPTIPAAIPTPANDSPVQTTSCQKMSVVCRHRTR